MFIACEGVDKAGKSTLVGALDAHVRRAYPKDTVQRVKCGPLNADALDPYAFSFERYRPGLGRHVICDRLHVGERCYGPLWRGEDRLGEAGFRFVELYLRARGAVTVVLTHDPETIKRRMREEGEELLAAEDVERVVRRFTELEATCATSIGSTVVVDDVNQCVRAIVEIAELRDAECAGLASEPGYVGPPRPVALLVGDRHGGKPPHRSEAAFIPVKGNCSEYLWTSLSADLWPRVGAVNAHECSDPAGLVSLLGDPVVVALGREADGVLEREGVEHVTVNHPQHAKRFSFSQRREYGEKIESVIELQRVTPWRG